MHKSSICVIGCSNLDVCIHIKGELIDEMSLKGHISFKAGGVGRNISANLASLKIYNNFISVFSKDIFGEILLDSINKEFVCLDDSIKDAEMGSVYCDILSESNHFGINDMPNSNELNPAFFSKKRDRLMEMEYIIIDLNLNTELINYLLKNIKTKWICDATSVIKCKKIENFLSLLYVLKANYLEAVEIVGAEKDCKIECLADKLINMGINKVFITLGCNGAVFADKNLKISMKHKIPLLKKSTVGAGDVFLSGVIYGYLSNYNAFEVLLCAMKLAYSYIKEGTYQLNNNVIKNVRKIKEDEIDVFVWSELEKKWVEYADFNKCLGICSL